MVVVSGLRAPVPAPVRLQTRQRHLWPALRPAELKVIQGVAEGLTDHEIAHQRNLATQTVKNQVNTALRVTATRNRPHLIALLDDYHPGWRERLPLPGRGE